MSRNKETVNFDTVYFPDPIHYKAAQILVPALPQGDLWRRINCCRQVALLLAGTLVEDKCILSKLGQVSCLEHYWYTLGKWRYLESNSYKSYFKSYSIPSSA